MRYGYARVSSKGQDYAAQVEALKAAGCERFERGLIRKRCEEGIQRAKRQGKQFGRPNRLDAGQKRVVADRYAKGETMAELARDYEVGEATIWRALRPHSPPQPSGTIQSAAWSLSPSKIL